VSWATIQNNLGNGIHALGSARRTARLEEAVAAFRDALMERTPERVLID